MRPLPHSRVFKWSCLRPKASDNNSNRVVPRSVTYFIYLIVAALQIEDYKYAMSVCIIEIYNRSNFNFFFIHTDLAKGIDIAIIAMVGLLLGDAIN